MSLHWLAWIGLVAAVACLPVQGQTLSAQPGQQDALQWLQRVHAAAQKLSYSGTFVYRNGTQSETSRIVHVATNGNQIEKLEVLDGSPREVIRNNDEVKCYLPDSRLVIVEHRSARRAFPALLTASLASLNEHYVIRKVGRARVAGLDSQIIRLEPRDSWRYGHQFWVDQDTGLLLKADMFSEFGESLETLVFTELRIGEPNSLDALKPSFANTSQQTPPWQVREAKSREMRGEESPWLFRVELPGFRRQAALRRNITQEGGKDPQEVLHWVFSDGLAAVSIFINPLRSSTEPLDIGAHSLGAISVMKRVIGGYVVVVMGDVPPAAVKRFAEGIEVRGK